MKNNNKSYLFICLFMSLIVAAGLFAAENLERPAEIQQSADKLFTRIKGETRPWGLYNGDYVFGYNLLKLEDKKAVDEAIRNAPTDKQDLYFIDIGCGNNGWGKYVRAYLKEKYSDSNKTFHVIGLTGDYESKLIEEKDGNIVYKYITGFNAENLEASLSKYGLDLQGSVEVIVSSWAFIHFLDPLGTLAQAYELLSPGNGRLFTTGFFVFLENTKDKSARFEHNLEGRADQDLQLILGASNAEFVAVFSTNTLEDLLLFKGNDKPLFDPGIIEYTGKIVPGLRRKQANSNRALEFSLSDEAWHEASSLDKVYQCRMKLVDTKEDDDSDFYWHYRCPKGISEAGSIKNLFQIVSAEYFDLNKELQPFSYTASLTKWFSDALGVTDESSEL